MTSQTADGQRLHGPGLTDVRMMQVAHSNFRRELGLSPAAIRAVAGGDRRRTSIVADHAALFLSLLHHHHTIEDDLLWAALLERVPAELAPLVHVMQSQHEHVAALMDQAHAALGAWRRTASAPDGEALAAILSDLCTALFEHLQRRGDPPSADHGEAHHAPRVGGVHCAGNVVDPEAPDASGLRNDALRGRSRGDRDRGRGSFPHRCAACCRHWAAAPSAATPAGSTAPPRRRAASAPPPSPDPSPRPNPAPPSYQPRHVTAPRSSP